MSTNEHTATEKRDVYAGVPSQIINAIEAGVSNWRMPWHTSGKFAFSPVNVTSKKPYRGINTVCLWAAAQAKGYERGEWGTYQQWQGRGAQVRKGEKATTFNRVGRFQNFCRMGCSCDRLPPGYSPQTPAFARAYPTAYSG